VSPDIETCVIGAGVIGLAIAQRMAEAGREVIVLERHGLIGSETSSRNSEVIHAGIYYPQGSMRAELCVDGKKLLYKFLRENGVAYQQTGKLLVATNEAQVPKLKGIVENAAKNGVTDLQFMSQADAKSLEPNVACTAAVLSPSTGVVDSHGYMIALEGHISSRGGSIILNSDVRSISFDGHVYTLNYLTHEGTKGAVTCRELIVSAGLHVTPLVRTLEFHGRYQVPETYFAKGQYYALSGKSPFSRHIYPMPDGAWLGLHATIDIGGRCKFGPDIEWIDGIDYSFDEQKLASFLDFIRSYYPGLDASKLHADYVGIRPKLYREGEPVADFRIDGPDEHGLPNLIVLSGMESPGLTASLAIGSYVARRLGLTLASAA
jgi:L-2-hydroxyglutarate oxidase LhgO